MSNELTIIEDDQATGFGGGVLAVSPTVSTAVALAAAVLDKRVATARAYPRRISRFKQEAGQLLREDIETAKSAEYARPVGGGVVRGPSIRLAELAALCWGNLDVETSEPIVTDKSVIVKATAWDLERNYRQESVVTVSILSKTGNRYPQHMIETTVLAAAAKAKRNAIISVIPRAYINDLLKTAKEVASGHEDPLDVKRDKILGFFAKSYKVTEQQICSLLNVAGIEDIVDDHVDTLRGVAEAIKEGTPPEEFFPTRHESKTEAVKSRLAEMQSQQQSQQQPQKPRDRLNDLLDELKTLGGLDAFLKRHNTTLQEVEGSRTKKRSDWITAVNAEASQVRASLMGAGRQGLPD